MKGNNKKEECKMTETDAAYIAGLIDGEGSLVLAKSRCKDKTHMGKRGFVWEPRISIGMTDTEGLDFIKKICGKKRLREALNKGYKKMYFLTLYSNGIRQFLPLIAVYLKVKQKQSQLLLEAVDSLKPKSDIDVDDRLEEIYLKLKELNHSRYKPI